VVGSLFGLYLLLNLFVSLSPLMSEQERAIDREISQRARVMAREIAERNIPFIAAKADAKLDLGTFNKAHAVRVAVIVDMESRVLAPASKAGTYFQNPPSAAGVVIKASKSYSTNGKLTGFVSKVDDDTIIAVEPIDILNPVQSKNETRAMAVVVLDTSLSTLDGGSLWMVYAHTLVLSILIGLFVFYLIYRITIRPIQDMNRKVDRVLRGENVEFKPVVYFSEMDPLWDLIDSALKRVPKGDDLNPSSSSASRGVSSSDLIGPLRTMASASSNGVAVLDEERKILFINSIFEEITGVRFESSEGQMLTAASRDQAFSALISDLCDRALPGTEGATEEFDFSGLEFKIHVVSFGPFGDPKCFVFTLTRKEE
jgi:PAS domain-containing protein